MPAVSSASIVFGQHVHHLVTKIMHDRGSILQFTALMLRHGFWDAIDNTSSLDSAVRQYPGLENE